MVAKIKLLSCSSFPYDIPQFQNFTPQLQGLVVLSTDIVDDGDGN